MRRFLTLLLLVIVSFTTLQAQRRMENLGRGLVAVTTTNGVYLSWRLLGQEWYDVEYNVYRDGVKVNTEPLTTSNYLDSSGSATSTYAVAPVVRGVEQDACAAVSPWKSQYMDIVMKPVLNAAGTDISGSYTLNDCSAADLDGDGEYEIIVKRMNNDFTKANTIYTLFQAYKLDGTLLWTLNVGPNLINANHVETNCMAYDFNGDGKAEVVIRLTDGSILPDGTVIGNATVNYRPTSYSDGNSVYQTQGDEWLYVLEGATGKVIDDVKFDADAANGNNLARRSAAFWWEGNSKAYGHRANKFHFGAPYLDGRNPSIYVGRGCYTNIHMATYDLVNNQLKLRWTYACDDTSSKFYGQGYHNFSIVDVDEDGRDEICHGNMVIDEYGKELSSTGLGHGDAQHYGDLDPYRKGLEGFRCLEDNPGAVFVDATTNEILFRWIRGNDNGRCLAGNFTDKWPGAELWTTDGKLWSATLSRAADQTVDNKAPGVTMNNRIYWDGDILEESFDYKNGQNTDGAVYKYGNTSPIFTTSGCATNNGTKGNPGLQADLFGDWREEIVLRTNDDKRLRIYTTIVPTEHRNYTLMHDKQYRQAVYWQMTAYNQPPHVSYFLGKAEGITVPPPPVMSNGRILITSEITAEHNDKHLLMTNATGGTVTVADGATPYILTVNSLQDDWTLSGASFSGTMRLIKQGQGALTFSGNHTYTGVTELWEGVTNFEGSLESPVWMNRFAELNSAAIYNKGITMEYGAILRLAENDKQGTLTAASLTAKRGAILEMDIWSEGLVSDTLLVGGQLTLADEAVLRIRQHNLPGDWMPTPGDYLLAQAENITADVTKLTVEGLSGIPYKLKLIDNTCLYLEIIAVRPSAEVAWNGTTDNNSWDLINTENFLLGDAAAAFVTGDKVLFTDAAAAKSVSLVGELVPESVVFNNSESYTLGGDGYISGNASLVKEGEGKLTVNNVNGYTGGTLIKGGEVVPASLATTQSAGSLGALSSNASKLVLQGGAKLTINNELFNESAITMGEGGGVINVAGTFHQNGKIAGTTLTKTGSGTLKLYAANTHKKTILDGGTIQIVEEPNVINGYLGDTLIIRNGTLQCVDNSYSYSSAAWHIVVPEGGKARINLDGRCNYTGTLTGSGELTVYAPYVRNYLEGDWSKFAGTIIAMMGSDGDFTFNNANSMPLATLNVASGCVVRQANGKDLQVYAIDGTGTLGGSGTWIVGNDDKNNTFSGTITSALKKVGTNRLTLKGSNTFEGNTEVTAGTLWIGNTKGTTSSTGAGVLTVYDGATLTGAGYVGNNRVVINNGGLFQPGQYNTGTLTVKSILELKEGGVLAMRLNGNGSCVTLNSVKNLLLSGIVRITLKDGYTPALGDSYNLWSSTAISSKYTPTVELPELPAGLAWDTTELLTKSGLLKVTDATGLHLTTWDEPVEADVYSLDGLKVGSFNAPYNCVGSKLNETSLSDGIYIVRMKGANGIGTLKLRKN